MASRYETLETKGGIAKIRYYGSGSLAYKAVFRRKGHPGRSRTFPRRGDARKWLDGLKADSDRQLAIPRARDESNTLKDVALAYLSSHRFKEAERRRVHLERWTSVLGNPFVRRITPGMIERGRGELEDRESLSSGTSNRHLRTLSHALTFAQREGWLETHPIKGGQVKSRSETKRRVNLSAEEGRAVLEACSERLRPMVRLAIETGMRQTQILGLRWEPGEPSWVDLEHQHIVITRGKNEDPQILPLTSGDIEGILRPLRAARVVGSPWVFGASRPNWNGALRGSWERARTAIGRPDLRFHDLRHVFASRLAQTDGATLPDLMGLMGHRSLGATSRYVDLFTDRQRELREKSERDRRG